MRVDVVVIGGGQAGLAASRELTARGLDHVVLERGRVGERWRSERWDSLHLLTPRWMARLPGWSYTGSDPDGFMSRREVIGYLEGYAASFPAPVLAGVTVTRVERLGGSFVVETDHGTFLSAAVIVATGHCDRPHVPAEGAKLTGVDQVVPTAYRNPGQLAEGGVLVVGASATGIQLAAEIHASGRPVTLAVGRHTRLPRTWRGRDIFRWLDEIGALERGADMVPDLEAARAEPSLQLVGSAERRSLDLAVLQEAGVRLVGRLQGAERLGAHFAGDLADTLRLADEQLRRRLRRIDEHIERAGRLGALPRLERPRPVPVPHATRYLDLRAEGIRTVVWATGYRRRYPWLRAPVLDPRGEIRHEGGVTAQPGLYVLGLNFLRRRNSSFIDGVGADARWVVERIHTRWEGRGRAVA